jgi:hypothetical protein
MDQPLPVLLENAIQIAWDYLERTGQIDDVAVASRFLSDNIELMIKTATASGGAVYIFLVRTPRYDLHVAIRQRAL